MMVNVNVNYDWPVSLSVAETAGQTRAEVRLIMPGGCCARPRPLSRTAPMSGPICTCNRQAGDESGGCQAGSDRSVSAVGQATFSLFVRAAGRGAAGLRRPRGARPDGRFHGKPSAHVTLPLPGAFKRYCFAGTRCGVSAGAGHGDGRPANLGPSGLSVSQAGAQAWRLVRSRG